MTSRGELLAEMRDLNQRGIDCNSCQGTCCTFVANSMQISEDEAQVIADHLRAKPDALEGWQKKLQASIERFGLNRPEAGDGRRQLSRRRYTCPFHLAPGCALPFEVKPLGCLAFNPRSRGLTEGGDCATSGIRTIDDPTLLRPIPLAVLTLLR